ncbi:DNA polymerase III subunit epsilon [Limnobacter litoralis]|uniref:DNA polymerase III subunit epsilon n=1 Tax=Limnobacter litoralis TaxID=481366 RepID=A0ABQ5YWB1_9BURK|nr:DNA polymerase III subunit epsilon [Limnobacter litoralis]GLR26777.1 DNA polymerase III subunit epsilon [Limnobacter litoralis]
MKYIVLDTETTGLEVRLGHRLIEVGCIEVAGRQVTDNTWHQYINPERAVDEGAFQVHGISDDMLADKPVFAKVAQSFLDFIRGSTLIIHNASFDVGFLDMELERLNMGRVRDHVEDVIDSLAMAREMFPGKRNNLDALCDRLGVNNGHRTLHGALLDAQILAEVYLAMTRGQDSLVIDLGAGGGGEGGQWVNLAELELPDVVVTDDEAALHAEYLATLDREVKGKCVWNALQDAPETA